MAGKLYEYGRNFGLKFSRFGKDTCGHLMKVFGDVTGKYFEWNPATNTFTVSGTIVGNITGTSDIQGTVIAAIDLTADVTLTATQAKATRLEVSVGDAVKSIIVPVGLPGKIYVVVNNAAAAQARIKVAGGTALVIAATKTAIFQVNNAGTEVTRLTADA